MPSVSAIEMVAQSTVLAACLWLMLHISLPEQMKFFYVLEGEYIMYLEDREFVCPAGSFIFIPQGARHGFKVGDVPSSKLNFYFPASMIGYFDDLAAALQRESVSDEELAEIAAAHAMEIVGPPSERYV